MNVNEMLSFGPIIISIISIILSAIAFFLNKKYLKNQDKINKLMILKEQRDTESLDTANVTAEVVSDGNNNDSIKITNMGFSLAKEVNLFFQKEKNNWILLSEDLLPIEILHPNQSVNLPLSLSGQSERKLACTLKWTDLTGKRSKPTILFSD